MMYINVRVRFLRLDVYLRWNLEKLALELDITKALLVALITKNGYSEEVVNEVFEMLEKLGEAKISSNEKFIAKKKAFKQALGEAGYFDKRKSGIDSEVWLFQKSLIGT